MTEQVGRATGRTRWRRFGVAMIPGLAAVVGLGFALSQGALAASFAVSGSQFKVSASSLDGTDFKQFGSAVFEKDGTPHPVVVSVIGEATLKDLCQTVVQDTPFGELILKITAGQGDHVVEATNLVVDATQLAGNATFSNIKIGRDASDLGGQAGGFGQSADSVLIENLQQTAWATTAGTFSLAGLNLGFSNSECF